MKRMEVTKAAINGTDFYIRPFGAFTAANMSGELGAVLLPVVTVIAPIFGGSGISAEDLQDEKKSAAAMQDFLDEDIDEYLPQIGKALGSLDGNKVETLMRKLLVDYKNITFEDESGEVTRLTYEDADEIFCGDIFGMYKLCYQVIKVNFGGFFDLLGNLSGNALSL